MRTKSETRFGQEIPDGMREYFDRTKVERMMKGKSVQSVRFDKLAFNIQFEDGSMIRVAPDMDGNLEVSAGG